MSGTATHATKACRAARGDLCTNAPTSGVQKRSGILPALVPSKRRQMQAQANDETGRMTVSDRMLRDQIGPFKYKTRGVLSCSITGRPRFFQRERRAEVGKIS